MNTRRSDRAFLGLSALAFLASAVTTVLWCGSMSGMPGMKMPGGWTMSMAWMRMPGQSWLDAAATFIAMWTVMMIAMMLPSLVSMLSRYRQVVGGHGALTASATAGYFGVWTILGVVAFPFGIALSELAMRVPGVARAVPIVTGLVVLIAGALQISTWKARQLSCCRETPRAPSTGVAAAFRHGLRLGVRCVRCCAGLTAMLFAIGVMDLLAMAVVTAAISAERLLPRGEHVARWTGAVIVTAGLVLLATA
jgi:predicted metal-binding membrane protein